MNEKSKTEQSDNDVSKICLSAQEFETKMKELLPDASEIAIKKLISYGEELDESGIHPKDDFFNDNFVCYSLAAKQYGREMTGKALDICEVSCFNHWEVLDAVRLVSENVPPSEIIQKAVDGELDLVGEQWDEFKAGLAALENGTFNVS